MESREICKGAIGTCNMVAVVMMVMRMGSPMMEDKTKVVDTFCSSLNLGVAALAVTLTATVTVIITEAGISSANSEGCNV